MTTRKTKASTGDEADDYGVGYGKPPKDTQFRPGQSGNAAGRRKGVRNLKTDVKRALATRVKVKRGSAARRQSAQETLLMLALDVSFQQVVHPVLTEEAEVAETADSKGEPDERAQECPSDATRSRANCTAG